MHSVSSYHRGKLLAKLSRKVSLVSTLIISEKRKKKKKKNPTNSDTHVINLAIHPIPSQLFPYNIFYFVIFTFLFFTFTHFLY